LEFEQKIGPPLQESVIPGLKSNMNLIINNSRIKPGALKILKFRALAQLSVVFSFPERAQL
jgi:hypothetical protein